jgi:hypothetical protein
LENIRICIGTEPRTEIAKKVLQFSILKNVSKKYTVEFFDLNGKDWLNRGVLGEGTGFSTLRFSIPENFEYEGKAIYLDADMLVLGDISELWNMDKVYKQNSNNVVWCKYGNQLMLIDCKKARDKILTTGEIEKYLDGDKDRALYRRVMKLSYLEPRPQPIPVWWNVMDKGCVFTSLKDFDSRQAKLLHYTNVPNQPWYNPGHAKVAIWERWLADAVKDGIVTKQEIKDAVAKYDVSVPRRPNGMHKYWLKYT